MAEGGDLTSTKDGSDADFEYTCTPCGDDDIREEAVKYCPVCEEFLCTSCTRQHGRRKALRSHTLQDCDASTKGSKVTMVTKCRYHPDRDIEMYCGEHDMVFCAKCIAKDHRSCRGVSDLEEVTISSNQQNEFQRLNSNIGNIQTRLEENKRKLQTITSSVEKQKNDVISQVEAIERDMVEHIQTLKHEALKALETEYSLVKEDIETNISQISKLKQQIEKTRSQLQTAHNFNMREQFVQTKLIQQTVNDAMKLFKQSEDKGPVCLRFTENTELKSFITTSTCLGRVERVIENSILTSKVFKVSSRKDINIKMKNDRKCYIGDICQLADGTIILTDLKNNKIKRLDVNYNIKDVLDLEEGPTGICCTCYTEIAVKLNNNKVWFISVGSLLCKLRDISVTGGCYYGLAYCTGELWVSAVNYVNVYSMTGTFIKSISNNVYGQPVFKSSTSIQQNAVSGDTVIVTDYSDGAVCLNRDGTVNRELRDKRLANTRGVCVANNGTVFISGSSSHNIMMFDRDGECLGELVDNKGGLKNPLAMCYDKKKNCVLVASVSSDKLVVLSISH